MRSIRTKITSLTVSAVAICTLFLSAVSVLTFKAREEQRSKQLMHLLCEMKCEQINHYLGGIEDAAETVSHFIYDTLDVVPLYEGGVIGADGSGNSLRGRERTQEQRDALNAYLFDHLSRAETAFQTIAGSNANVLGYYYQLNPKLGGAEKGFWYSRHRTADFRPIPLPGIGRFSADDFGHVGWYYLPLERGRPSWLDPYENQNIGVTMVSYVVPLYKYGTFIGVIGIDLRYETLVDHIRDLSVLDTGYAFLTDAKGKIVYHPELQNGLLLGDVSDELQSAGRGADQEMTFRYLYNGVQREAAWGTLSNGLRLFVTAPVSEINADWQNLLWFLLGISLLILAVFIAIALSLVRRITNPLERLAEASEQLAQGNYNVELSYTGNDEVGTLTRSFQQMAENLQAFIEDLNSKAYRDAMTGVRNKRAFHILTEQLNESIRQAAPGDAPAFAVAMFDCNNLKTINDNYGHEKGDAYLRAACRLICRVYAHSPVFRIGGDEFASILQADDFAKREELDRIFECSAENINSVAENEWDKVSIARGIVEYDPEVDDSMESVLRRADSVMYENKKILKSRQ